MAWCRKDDKPLPEPTMNQSVHNEPNDHISSWWRHQMETFSALLALYVGNSPVTREFPSQRPVTRSLMFSLICAWTNAWVSNGDAGGLRRHRAHGVTVIFKFVGTYAGWGHVIWRLLLELSSWFPINLAKLLPLFWKSHFMLVLFCKFNARTLNLHIKLSYLNKRIWHGNWTVSSLDDSFEPPSRLYGIVPRDL